MKTKIIFILISFLITSNVISQNWYPLSVGMNSDIFAVAVYNGQLIAGGIFDSAGGEACSKIARWDGTKWWALGSGTSGGFYNLGVVRALTVFNGELIVGGYFALAGGNPAVGIAKWNGSTWSALSSGMGGVYPHVEALIAFDNQLIATGTFSIAGGSQVNGIARWDGSNWLQMGSGLLPTDSIGGYALAVWNNVLYVGGNFLTAGGTGAKYLASWNGSSWSGLSTGIQGSLVKSLTVFNNQLIIGGNFYQAGSTTVNNITRWNGSSFLTLGTGTNSSVYALYVHNSQLHAAGYFTYAGGISANYIARWNGSVWSSIGTGSNNGMGWITVALGPDPIVSGNLIAAGYFSTAGGVPAKRIATYGNPTLIQNNNEIARDYLLSQNYPNPFNPNTTIEFSIPKSSQVVLKIYDQLGKEVEMLVNSYLNSGSYSINWSAENLISGVYYYKITAGDFTDTKKMTLVK